MKVKLMSTPEFDTLFQEYGFAAYEYSCDLRKRGDVSLEANAKLYAMEKAIRFAYTRAMAVAKSAGYKVKDEDWSWEKNSEGQDFILKMTNPASPS